MITRVAPDNERCTARSSRTGKRCTKYRMKGQKVCDTHGGQAPQAKQAAERRQQEQEAERAVVLYGLPREVDPHQALLEELWRTAGHVAWLRDRVAELEDADQLHGPVGSAGGDTTTAYPREEPHIWVRLYQEERKHLASVAAACIKAGIEERRIALAEEQAALIAQFARGLLSDLGIDPGSDKARKAYRRHLTLVAGGQA